MWAGREHCREASEAARALAIWEGGVRHALDQEAP